MHTLIVSVAPVTLLTMLALSCATSSAATFTQATAGATDETSDEFGRALASGDFNNDGYADLAVGVPRENTDGATDTGMIDIFYGSADGLSTSAEQITQNSIVTATNEDGDHMGWALAVGNFNGDEYDDLAVGIPEEDADGAEDTGMVAILFGSAQGLLPSNTEAITQNSIVTASNEDGDRMGWSLAAGNFNGDAYDDLAVGFPFEDTDGATDTGMVGILFGSANGLLPSNSEALTQNSVVTATNEDGDQFGYTLAAGNFNGDDYDDLAVGIPFENTDGFTDTGLVAILFGSANGLLPSSSEAFTQNSITGAANEDFDNIGRALAVGNFNGDSYDDLAVGAPFEDIGSNGNSGATFVMYGSASGLLPASNEVLSQDDAYDDEGADERAGYSLAAGDYDGDGFDDLVVGVPREDIENSGNNTGAIQAFFGSASGLLPQRSYWAGQVSFGGAEENNDEFGFALAAGDFDNDGKDGLAVGAPFDDIGNIVNSGAVFVQEIDPGLPIITAKAAIVLNRNTGEILGSKMPDLRLAMASTTKIMTALLAVEDIEAGNQSLGDIITISNNAATVSGSAPDIGSSMNGPGPRTLVTGDRMSLEDLFYGTMLPSGNNAAIALGESVTGNEADFVALMNARAGTLGMNRTVYASPHGRDPEKTMASCPNISFSQSINLDDPGCAHFSTARDLADLAEFALGKPLFRTVVSTPQWNTTTWVNSNGVSQDAGQTNTNQLIGNGTNYYRGAYGVKTGTTGNAGECLVSSARRCGVDLVAVVLGSDDDSNARYPDSRAILDFAFSRAIEVPDTLTLNFIESFEVDGLDCRYLVPGIADSFFDISAGDYLGVVDVDQTAFTGASGAAVFAVQDIPDNGQGDGQGSLTFAPFKLAGMTSVSVSMRVAAGTAGAFESGDAIRVEYRFGKGTWNPLGAFLGDGGPGGSHLYEDTNLDGVGDGAILDSTFQNFSWNTFTGGNPSVQVRVRFENFNSAAEPAAIDRVRVVGSGPGGISLRDWLLINDLARVTQTSDADRNGVLDFMEFLFNQDPNDPYDRGNLPRLEMSRTGRHEYHFSRLLTEDGTLNLERSGSMARGTWREALKDADYRVRSIRPNSADPLQEDVIYELIPRVGSEKMFFRLRGEDDGPFGPR